MIHVIHLNSPWFELVSQGKKVYEGRRRTNKTLQWKKGDILHIKHYTNPNAIPFDVTIENIIEYPDFKTALQDLPIHEVLPIENITLDEGVEIYQRYVSLSTQSKDGIVMIKVRGGIIRSDRIVKLC